MGKIPKRLKKEIKKDESNNPRSNGQLICKVCGKEFKRPCEVYRHSVVHVPKSETYICNCCNLHYDSKTSLINHFRPVKKSRYNCSVCGIGFCEYRLLFFHIRHTHFNLEGKQMSYASKMLNETWLERVLKSEVYVEMTKITANAIAIRKYVKNEATSIDDKATEDKNKRESIKKNIAKVKSKAKSVLKGKLTKAKCIDKTKAKEGTYKDKDKVETDKDKTKEGPFFDCGYYSEAVCDYCGKGMLKKSLVVHIKARHLKMRQYACKECGRTFQRHYQMMDHICNRSRKRATDS